MAAGSDVSKLCWLVFLACFLLLPTVCFAQEDGTGELQPNTTTESVTTDQPTQAASDPTLNQNSTASGFDVSTPTPTPNDTAAITSKETKSTLTSTPTSTNTSTAESAVTQASTNTSTAKPAATPAPTSTNATTTESTDTPTPTSTNATTTDSAATPAPTSTNGSSSTAQPLGGASTARKTEKPSTPEETTKAITKPTTTTEYVAPTKKATPVPSTVPVTPPMVTKTPEKMTTQTVPPEHTTIQGALNNGTNTTLGDSHKGPQYHDNETLDPALAFFVAVLVILVVIALVATIWWKQRRANFQAIGGDVPMSWFSRQKRGFERLEDTEPMLNAMQFPNLFKKKDDLEESHLIANAR
ncbi:Hypp7069 [Branchiostoma lanceolatum]|uniref:Hypp7069 protein n=1 Tax=Branchiostoma lanceolatum TaxID=7740 RepID=A0A8J9YX30_BRALA|nr:Hypp7069 [Branchiostoma lanceolatum]